MKLTKMIKRFIKDERGLEASEYALLLALICIVLVVAIQYLVNAINETFHGAADVIDPPPATT